jgi:hypothetical protein
LTLISLVNTGFVVSGGQDKIIYVHKPGDTQPSHVLVGHESNVFRRRMKLIQVCTLDVGTDGTIISGSWDKYTDLSRLR